MTTDSASDAPKSLTADELLRIADEMSPPLDTPGDDFTRGCFHARKFWSDYLRVRARELDEDDERDTFFDDVTH